LHADFCLCGFASCMRQLPTSDIFQVSVQVFVIYILASSNRNLD
jgi:hypothetical protein